MCVRVWVIANVLHMLRAMCTLKVDETVVELDTHRSTGRDRVRYIRRNTESRHVNSMWVWAPSDRMICSMQLRKAPLDTHSWGNSLFVSISCLSFVIQIDWTFLRESCETMPLQYLCKFTEMIIFHERKCQAKHSERKSSEIVSKKRFLVKFQKNLLQRNVEEIFQDKVT